MSHPYNPQDPHQPYGQYPQQGYPVQPAPYAYGYAPQPRRTNGLAIASLVLGITGIFICGITALLALIFGHVALGQIRRDGTDGRGMALAGAILGWLTMSIWLVYWVLVLTGTIAGMWGQTY